MSLKPFTSSRGTHRGCGGSTVVDAGGNLGEGWVGWDEAPGSNVIVLDDYPRSGDNHNKRGVCRDILIVQQPISRNAAEEISREWGERYGARNSPGERFQRAIGSGGRRIHN